MSAAETEAVVRRFVEGVMIGGNVDAVDELISPEQSNHDPIAPGVPDGPESIRQLTGMFRAAFPDIHFRTGEMFAVEDRVAHRWTFTGTHEGEILAWGPPAGGSKSRAWRSTTSRLAR